MLIWLLLLYLKGNEYEQITEEYDYGARLYDPAIGRFTTIDPSAEEEEQESWSPYHYVYNNPIKHIDPDGRVPIVLPFLYAAGEAILAGAAAVTTYVGGRAVVEHIQNKQTQGAYNTSTPFALNRPVAPTKAHIAHIKAKLESTGTPPNPNGAKGKADHQEKVKELAEKARAENPG